MEFRDLRAVAAGMLKPPATPARITPPSVSNVHQRRLAVPAAQVGAVLDTLASRDDQFWPSAHWPRLRFDRPLGVGATGGHGPVRYFVEAYEPGRLVRCRFTAPRGFLGTHALVVQPVDAGTTVLRHELFIEPRGPARITWPLVFEPLHDALIEDGLDRAAIACGQPPVAAPWSRRVRALRALLARMPRRPGRK